jgi:ribonuclease HI
VSSAPLISIYTDGSARGNPGPGGYGIIFIAGSHYKEVAAGFRLTTNNRMELWSVCVALEMLKFPGSEVTIFSDSQYVVNSVEKNWLGGWVKRGWKNVKNPDLWKRYLVASQNHKVRFVWIRGHNGHTHNERCDQLAVEAATGKDLKADSWYESHKEETQGFL